MTDSHPTRLQFAFLILRWSTLFTFNIIKKCLYFVTDKSYWRTKAIDAVNKKLKEKIIKGVAKNIIFFLGDGMSVPTIAASRIYLGQLNGKSGENSRLSFEELPYTGVSKV